MTNFEMRQLVLLGAWWTAFLAGYFVPGMWGVSAVLGAAAILDSLREKWRVRRREREQQAIAADCESLRQLLQRVD